MSGTEKKILFVEDDPVVLTLYRNRLQREGFEILFAEDGEVALSVLSRVRPDLVVLDLMLPKVNGVEVLKHIRSDERLKATPVLILSNAYLTELAQKALQSGATKGMLKTECTPAKLVETVRDLLGFEPVFGLTAGKPISGRSQAEAFVAAAAAAHADEMTLKATREEFIKDAPAEVTKIREHCLAYIKGAASPAGLQQLNNLYQRVHFLTARAGLAGCSKAALLASAFEALLFEIVFKPTNVTASVLQTIAQAVDCLGHLFNSGDTGTAGLNLKARILIVDDDPVCNYAMVAALKRAHFEPVSVEDPAVAVQMLDESRFDLVLLDINMPVMNGFELCEKLRSMPQYKETPAIFITGNGDFQNRAQGILSGGNDLITKPTSPLELVLKTTMHLLQPLGRRPEPPTGVVAPRLEAPPVVSPPAPPAQSSPPPIAAATPLSPEISTSGNGAPRTPPAPEEEIKLPPAAEDAGLPKSDGQDQLVPPEVNQPPAPPEVKNEMPPAAVQTGAPPVTRLAPPAKAIAPQRPAPPNNTNLNLNMENKNKPAIEEVAQGVARIIFGEVNLTDMNVRLTRIALEHYNVPEMQNSDEIAQAVARIMFGDENLTDMNVRLTRIALERYSVAATPGRPAAANNATLDASRLSPVSL